MNNIAVYPLRVSNHKIINYCYLIVDTINQTAVIVDPAWELVTIEQKLHELKIELSGILLTHAHFDHVNLAESLAIKYQIPVFMSRVEIDYYRFQCTHLTPIEQFNSFRLAGLIIQPIFTPGHTRGGTCYLMGDNLFCGDTLFIEGCGLCIGEGADPNEMFYSLQQLKRQISPNAYIYPGHCYGQPVGQKFAYLLQNNIYLQFKTKEEFVAFRMRSRQKNLFNFR